MPTGRTAKTATASRKRGRPKKTSAQQGKLDLPLPVDLENVDDPEGFRDTLRFFLNSSDLNDSWRGVMAVPPGSLLQTVISAFHRNTNVPLEIPFFTTMSYISAHLLKHRTRIKFGSTMVAPGLWTVILARSGSTKSWSSNQIKKVVMNSNNAVNLLPDAASSAQFIANLAEHNDSLFVKDEFGKFLKNIETQGHMNEIKNYLLEAYDSTPISRSTKKETIEVENPAIAITGLTVAETFQDEVPPGSFVDGFAQRFMYVFAEPDPKRPLKDYPILDIDEDMPAMSEEWENLTKLPIHDQYTLSKKGSDAFRQSFEMLLGAHDVPESFFRRIMFSGVKYALIYHFVLGKGTDVIDAEDMAWAGRVIALHLNDVKRLIMQDEMSELEALVRKAERVREKCRQDGIAFTERKLIRSLNKIKTVSQAKAIMSLMIEETV